MKDSYLRREDAEEKDASRTEPLLAEEYVLEDEPLPTEEEMKKLDEAIANL